MIAEDTRLESAVQHLALMLLVNATVSPTGAARIGRASASEAITLLAEAAEDPRARSLARCVLDNVAQHAGFLHHLTNRQAPGKLQLATELQLSGASCGLFPFWALAVQVAVIMPLVARAASRRLSVARSVHHIRDSEHEVRASFHFLRKSRHT